MRITAEEKYGHLLGTKINKWKLLYFDHSRKKTDIVCECECGTIKPVNLQNLVNNRTKDCGCGRKKKMSDIRTNDLTGQRFGKLIVIEMLASNNLGKRTCRCKCDCGNEVIVVGASLTSGHTQSCGCLNSYGNMRIAQILMNKNIEYKQEYTIHLGDEYYRFDFYLPQYNLMIEYDGEQHFKLVHFAGKDIEKNIEITKRTQEHDKIKDAYCAEHNINLLRIPYTERENIEEIIENHLQRLSDKGVKQLTYATV